MIVIDTLSLASGDAKENSNTDMNHMMKNGKYFAREMDCFIMLIDHSGKVASKGNRGASRKYAAADVAI